MLIYAKTDGKALEEGHMLRRGYDKRYSRGYYTDGGGLRLYIHRVLAGYYLMEYSYHRTLAVNTKMHEGYVRRQDLKGLAGSILSQGGTKKRRST